MARRRDESVPDAATEDVTDPEEPDDRVDVEADPDADQTSGEESSEAAADADGAHDERADADPALVAARELLAGADPEEYYKSIAGLARPGSLLRPLDYSPDEAFHRPTTVTVQPAPAGAEMLNLYGHGAYRYFEEHLLEPLSDPRLDHLLTDVYSRLVHQRSNVALVTNHGNIIDIALVLGAFQLALCDPARPHGVLGEVGDIDRIVRRSNLVLSRMVTTQQVFNIPTPEVLQSVCRCFYTVPQTASRRKAKLDPDLARANNLVARFELGEQLDEGGQLLAMAASGSQDLSLAAGLVNRVRRQWRQRRGEEPAGPSLHLQPLYNGTIDLMTTCEYVVPVAISLSVEHPACVVGSVTRVTDAADCHGVMDWIAQAHQEATGMTTVYHANEDDLLDNIRGAIRG